MPGKTFTLGVLVSDILNPFYGLVIQGVVDQVEASGYEILIGPAGGTPRSQARMIDAMVDRQMDGLLLMSPIQPDADLEAVARRTPTVVAGRHGPARYFDTVAGDDIAGSRLIVDHLVALGHHEISHLTSNAD